MPITETDVRSPQGDIDPAVWFPGDSAGDFTTRVTGYITDAEGRTTDEDAQKQWVYYRAATAVADRLGGSGSSKTLTLVDQGAKTQTFTPASADYWAKKAAAYLLDYEALVTETEDDPLGGFRVLTSLRHN